MLRARAVSVLVRNDQGAGERGSTERGRRFTADLTSPARAQRAAREHELGGRSARCATGGGSFPCAGSGGLHIASRGGFFQAVTRRWLARRRGWAQRKVIAARFAWQRRAVASDTRAD